MNHIFETNFSEAVFRHSMLEITGGNENWAKWEKALVKGQ